MDSIFYHVALSLIPGLNPAAARLLLDYFGSSEAVFKKENLDQVEDLNPKIRESILQGTALKMAEEELRIIEKNQIQVRFVNDAGYPSRLRSCPDAPIVLYSRGFSNLNAAKMVSIVGTRQATAYGRNLTEQLIQDFAQAFPEMVIISGLAYGIDVCAHKAAFTNKLNTVAVLAHGLQEVYPAMHRDIASKLLSDGSLITELPWGTPSEPFRFVQRNRIVAGMCDACIVVESANKGGSLITARMAADYSREVFAYPGRKCDERSRGCNLLIKKQIAGLIESAEDVFHEMNWDLPSGKKGKQTNLFPELQAGEEKIYAYMKAGETYTCNELAIETDTKIGETLSLLMQMEMSGILESLPGGAYIRK